MALTVTSANTNNLRGGARNVMRSPSGIPYVVLVDATDGGIEVWKGDGVSPTAFSEQHASGNPQTSGYGCVSAAMDSSGVIHIAYMYYNTKVSQLRYVTFSTATDTFSGDVAVKADIGNDPILAVDPVHGHRSGQQRCAACSLLRIPQQGGIALPVLQQPDRWSLEQRRPGDRRCHQWLSLHGLRPHNRQGQPARGQLYSDGICETWSITPWLLWETATIPPAGHSMTLPFRRPQGEPQWWRILRATITCFA